MRREDFTMAVAGVDEGEQPVPTLVVEADGSPEALAARLEDVDGDRLEADGVDLAFRFTTDVDDDDATGVLAMTDRLTGDFVFELNADADAVLSFVRSARRDGDGRYRVRVETDGETLATYEKRTLLVYNNDGDLLREESLIPGGVEL
ncbi:MAG: DUF5793 family protein [Halobacteriaceae archaeon]